MAAFGQWYNHRSVFRLGCVGLIADKVDATLLMSAEDQFFLV